MAKELFNSQEEQKKEKREKELGNKVVLAENYKDQRNEPFGVAIISFLSIVLGGTLTGIFAIFNAFKLIGVIIVDIIIWILLLFLILYSIYYYIVNKKMPTEAILLDKEKNEIHFYNVKTKNYDIYKLDDIKSITYKVFTFYPKTTIAGPIPKKRVGDKILVELTNGTKFHIYILDVFKTRKLFMDIVNK